ncbi:hypothetical protein ACRS8P_21485 [Burkholderia cenocepacia]
MQRLEEALRLGARGGRRRQRGSGQCARREAAKRGGSNHRDLLGTRRAGGARKTDGVGAALRT